MSVHVCNLKQTTHVVFCIRSSSTSRISIAVHLPWKISSVALFFCGPTGDLNGLYDFRTRSS
jgi:hypothetical protein